MNIKKIGLTALAGSLVATTAFAGEMSVNGNASVTAKNNSGTDGGKSFTMGNQLTFSGGGELDNGLNVALSFVLDHGDNVASGFDSHSIKIGNDTFGTFTFAGDGTGNAQSALDTTAAGDVWDNGFTYGTTRTTKYTAMKGSDANNNKSINWALPAFVDGLAVAASYSGGIAATNSTTAYGLTYTGVEGLKVYYGAGEVGATADTGDITSMGASYAMGSFTAAYSVGEADMTTASDEEVTSYKLSYTVSEDLSVSYGEETHDTNGQSVDEEFESLSVSYTTGGMTITASNNEATGLGNVSGNNNEQTRWKLGAAFAF
ncbi:porin [Candidatus Pelagibacter sp.]|nr:porin [Candidatus Pelagibacter sp.]|tara:strand:+ start:245 stop:1195 length:951 start_codon:yes stop_codon:yes gene_type:complete